MPVYIALLRGINVGGRNLIAMADLRTLVEALGFADGRTLLQSGNLVFRCDRAFSSLERLLETETQKRLQVAADYIVRTPEEMHAIITANPFPAEATSDPSHLVVMFLKDEPDNKDVKSLQAANKGPEIIRSQGKQFYIYYPAGIGKSKLTGTLIEKKLGIRGTARNWNTVLKLAALAQK